MFNFRSLIFVFALIALVAQAGCNSGPTATEVLQSQLDNMKEVTKEFEVLLASVVDVETAEKTLPKLISALDRTLVAGKELEKAGQTNSRTAIVVKKETKDFRIAQGKRVKEQSDRLKSLPGVEEALKPMFEKMDGNYKPISEAN